MLNCFYNLSKITIDCSSKNYHLINTSILFFSYLQAKNFQETPLSLSILEMS